MKPRIVLYAPDEWFSICIWLVAEHYNSAIRLKTYDVLITTLPARIAGFIGETISS